MCVCVCALDSIHRGGLNLLYVLLLLLLLLLLHAPTTHAPRYRQKQQLCGKVREVREGRWG